MVKKKLSKILSLAFSFVLLANAFCMNASADEPYDVYNYDRWGEAVPSQAGYTADKMVTGEDLGISHFNSPSDIFRDHNDLFYIADTNNNRIVVVDSEFENVEKIYEEFTMSDGSKTTLNKPRGIYVSPEREWLYIADNENSRVLICDFDSNVIGEITKPESSLYSQNTFLPQKVISDKAGNVYVVLGNITTGAAMFNPEGEFTGFFGANRADASGETFVDKIKNIFSTQAKKDSSSRSVPSGITSFDLDDENFIYTCSQSSTQTTDTVKKLNAAGKNNFENFDMHFGDFTPIYDASSNTLMASAINDIDIGDNGEINCLDLTTGRIFQYDKECYLLFVVGTIANQVGGFSIKVSALESMGPNLYVVDNLNNSVTIFKETTFGEIVHEATNLYNEGLYEEALEPWYEVLKRDGNYHRAYVGIANALYNKGDYEGAMKYAELGVSSSRYNKAFEGHRAEFLDAHLTKIIFAIIILIVIFKLDSIRRKKKLNQKLIKNKEE